MSFWLLLLNVCLKYAGKVALKTTVSWYANCTEPLELYPVFGILHSVLLGTQHVRCWGKKVAGTRLFKVSQVYSGGDACLLIEPSDIDNRCEESCFWQGSKQTCVASETVCVGSCIDFKSKNIRSIRFGCDDWLTASGSYRCCQCRMCRNLTWQLSGILSKPQKGLGLAAALVFIEVH